MNQTYRGKNRTTDVLSFSGFEADIPVPLMAPTLLGQIVLCWPVIQSQARTFHVPASEELQRMTIHGILHVFGYDHEDSEQAAKKMFRLQEKILKA